MQSVRLLLRRRSGLGVRIRRYSGSVTTLSDEHSQSGHTKARIKLKDHKTAKRDKKDDDDDDDDKEAKLSKDYPQAKQQSDSKTQQDLDRNQNKAVFATKLGAAANIFLAVSKGAVGLSISSTALVADAANSLGDVLSDAVVYYTLHEARKTATPDRPWGRGKIEPLGALSVGALLLTTGLGIGYSASLAVFDMVTPLSVLAVPSPGDLIIGASGDSSVLDAAASAIMDTAGETVEAVKEAERELINNVAALGISGTSILAKEFLFRYTLKAGQKANSSVVVANAWQHRSDVSTSMAVFAGLIGSMMGYPILDPVAGILVAGVIIKQAHAIALDSLRDLSDAPASANETDGLRKTCLSVTGVLQVQELKARKSGPFLFVETTVGVDGSISASAAHRLAEITRLALLSKHYGRVANAVVHITPIGSSGLGEKYPSWARDHGFIEKEIRKAVKTHTEIIGLSEVQVYYKDDGLISTKVDIILPGNLTIHQAHAIASKARKSIEQVLPGIGSVDVDLELDET